MLDELKNLNYYGGKDGLLFFFCDVVGKNEIRIQDAEVICSHAPGKRHLSVGELIRYCHALGWIKVEEDVISLLPRFVTLSYDKEALNHELIISTIEQLFAEGILDSNMFSYDSVQCCYAFKNERLPLSLSCVRNVLISQGLLTPLRDDHGTRFYVEPIYDALIAKYCRTKRKQLSLELLKKQLENNELAGEKAELFVLSFEKKRIGHPLCDSIRRISDIDVAAGYDIVSYNSPKSQGPNRFIEVKAVSHTGFHWSRNEYEVARLKGNSYYLYLVDIEKINCDEYVPLIICNPAHEIMDSDKWHVEADSFHIIHI